jgi:hypothetical protein
MKIETIVYLLCTIAIFVVVTLGGAADIPECMMGNEQHRLVKTTKTPNSGR